MSNQRKILISKTVKLRKTNKTVAIYGKQSTVVDGGHYLKIPVSSLLPKSHAKVVVMCPRCRETRETLYNVFMGSETTYCPSCKRFITRFKDISGFQIGNITAIEPTGDKDHNGSYLWRCQCGCGNEIVAPVDRILRGGAKSCALGECHHWYNHQLTDEEREAHRKYDSKAVKWRNKVYKRDNHTCQVCGSTERLNAHHLFSVTPYKEKKYSMSNGITLCSLCHIDFHTKYGYGNNNQEQFGKWLKSTNL